MRLSPTQALVLLLMLCASGAKARGPLAVILLPGTSLTQWRQADAPNLHRLLATGAVAVMNTRTARTSSDRVRETPASAALTLGAGSRAAGGPEVTQFYPAEATVGYTSVRAADLFRRRTGQTPAPDLSDSRETLLVNTEWPRVLQENENRGYELRPGNLGDGLRTAGVLVRAGGGPLAAPVGVSHTGTVLAAAVPRFVAGHDCQCLLWDAGPNISDADPLVGRLTAQTAALGGLLVVMAPCVGDAAYARGNRLAPVVLWDPKGGAGLLYSRSTRRAGLVTNTDFCSVVANWFGAKLPAMAYSTVSDSPWRVTAVPDAAGRAASLEQTAYAQAAGMRLLPPLAVLLGLWMLAGTLGKRARPWMAWPPLAALLALTVGTSAVTALWWFAGIVVTVALATRRGNTQALTFALIGVEAALLVCDLCVGDPLMKRSLLGYSAVEGARYYGMGNEAMGVLAAAASVVTAWLWERTGRAGHAGLMAALVVVVAMLGAPSGGAKAGGILVCGTVFGVLLWKLHGAAVKPWTVAALLVVVALTLGLTAVGDAHRAAGPQSHLGQTVERVARNGWPVLAETARRKLAVEGRLAYHSAWACPLWIGLLSFLVKKESGAVSANALRGVGPLAVCACLAFNDAGVVAGALCGVVLWCARVADNETGLRPPEEGAGRSNLPR